MTPVKIEKTRGSKSHQKYMVDGYQVPGVTTVLNVLAKPALIQWANRIGLEGVSVGAYVDALASIGTCAHYLVSADLKGETPDTGDFTANELEAASRCVEKFEEWRLSKDFTVVESELQMVSAKHKYGGTLDVLAMVDGRLNVIDLKTGKGIYPEMLVQAAAYAELAIEAGHKVEEIRILNIGRTENEPFQEQVINDWSLHFGLFQAAKSVYEFQKAIAGKSYVAKKRVESLKEAV